MAPLTPRVREALERVRDGALLNEALVDGMTPDRWREPRIALAWLLAHAVIARGTLRLVDRMTDGERTVFAAECAEVFGP